MIVNLKIGDKIKCRKDFHSVITGNVIFKKDEYYLINDISDNNVRFTISRINGDYKTTFELLLPNFKTDYVYFLLFDYFYTEKELRQLKIESILI